MPSRQPPRPTSTENVVTQVNALIDLLGKLLNARYGYATVTFPGGVNFSDPTEVTHGLGTGALLRLATIDGLNIGTPLNAAPVIYAYAGTTVDKMKFQAVTTDGSSPAASTVVGFWWFVL